MHHMDLSMPIRHNKNWITMQIMQVPWEKQKNERELALNYES